MGGIAFVFSGQGDQYPGMGRELYETYPAGSELFRRLEKLRPGTMEQCFSGTAAELMETVNTQPCLYAMELAAAQVLLDKGVKPDAVAGFSLGEVAAAAVAGCFDPETGFSLVCKRGELMQQAAQLQETAMAAVVKLTAEEVTELCRAFPGVYPVNFNCPGNTTVSGPAAVMPDFCARVRAQGGRGLMLKVRGGFHSPYMQEAARGFAVELAKKEVRAPQIPLYSNVTGEVYGEKTAALLARQIECPVQWETLVRNMMDAGIDTFIEIGPGRTLTNMIQKIDPRVRAVTYGAYIREAEVC